MMIPEFEDLYRYCVQLFGKEKVVRANHRDPFAIEISIDVSEIPSSPVRGLELNIYRGSNPLSFMFADEFRFEYDHEEERGIKEMKAYLKALKEGRVYIKSWTFLGIKFNQRLLIRD